MENSSPRFRLAAIMACHNRKAKTLACLDRLGAACAEVSRVSLSVFLLDDASSDGTAEAVLARHPGTVLLRGDGTLFWNRGMHKAMSEAMKSRFDAYLWLNDDTVLAPGALQKFLSAAEWVKTTTGREGLLVGTTETSSDSGTPSYGGRRRVSIFRPLKFDLVEPGTVPLPCDTMNANCVMIPKSIIDQIGNLDPCFPHSMGDLDYGFRASKAGIGLWVVPGYIGVCAKNRGDGEWVDRSVPMLKRLALLNSTRGLPLWPWAVFSFRHGGPLGLFGWAWTYLNVIRTSIQYEFSRRFLK